MSLVVVVPSLPHTLILEIDLWSKIGLIPDLFSDTWCFRSTENPEAKIQMVHASAHLSRDEK